MRNATMEKRIRDGYTWFPARTIESGYGLGEYPFLVLERTTNTGKTHMFSSGNLVSVFSTEMENDDREVPGAVHWIDGDRMRVSFFSDELPSYLRYGKTGINLVFDERTFREMKNAVELVRDSRNNRCAELREVLLGNGQQNFTMLNREIIISGLNPSQNQAVQSILEADDVAVIHGPPGTGKTTTLVAAACELVKIHAQILVCALSNAAADLLAERLHLAGLSVLRVGNLSRIDESVIQNTLESKLSVHPEMKTVKEYRKRAEEFRRMAGKYKRNYGRAEREQRDALMKEAKSLTRDARKVEASLVTAILDHSQAIVTTLLGSIHSTIHDRRFPVAIIDEAAQALEPGTWIPVLKSDKIVLAGDPFQLPPTVKSAEAVRKGFSITLIEKQLASGRKVNLLDRQYRMNHLIMGFSNEWFYGGKLVADAGVNDWKLDAESPADHPLEFIDTAGCGFEEISGEGSFSLENPGEFRVLRTHLLRLASQVRPEHDPQIGIISPYRQQVRYMKESVIADPLLSLIPSLTVNTIDSFQGQERDIIYISLVRSNPSLEIGFLSDTRRMNVAMTRARKKLVIIGDSATIGNHEFYRALLIYCEKKGSYLSSWEFLD